MRKILARVYLHAWVCRWPRSVVASHTCAKVQKFSRTTASWKISEQFVFRFFRFKFCECHCANICKAIFLRKSWLKTCRKWRKAMSNKNKKRIRALYFLFPLVKFSHCLQPRETPNWIFTSLATPILQSANLVQLDFSFRQCHKVVSFKRNRFLSTSELTSPFCPLLNAEQTTEKVI